MERQESSHVDKSGWGDGPWQAEPDRIEWRDEATGLAFVGAEVASLARQLAEVPRG